MTHRRVPGAPRRVRGVGFGMAIGTATRSPSATQLSGTMTDALRSGCGVVGAFLAFQPSQASRAYHASLASRLSLGSPTFRLSLVSLLPVLALATILMGCRNEGRGTASAENATVHPAPGRPGSSGQPAASGQPGSPGQPGFTLALQSQPSGTGALLQAVSPVSEEVVWVSGHEGTYGRTVDGGRSWTMAVMPGEESLQFRDVEAFDASTAYLMSAGSGELSRIYRTDDGGEHWELQYRASEPTAFLDCMGFWDLERGLAYGDAVDSVPFVLRTVDGGRTWVRIAARSLPPALEGEGGFAASGTCLVTGAEGRAWIATGNGERARVLRTSDWGESWQVSEVPVVGGSGAGLTTVQVSRAGLGIALGGRIGSDTVWTENVALSVDGGVTWTLAAQPPIPGPIYGSALVLGSGAPNLRDPSETFVVAAGPRGLVWSVVEVEAGPAATGAPAPRDALKWAVADTVSYWAVAFASPDAGWAVGPGGRIAFLRFVRRE